MIPCCSSFPFLPLSLHCILLAFVLSLNHAAPAPLHHLSTPSSAPVTNEPFEPAVTCGLHETAHTSLGCEIVDTAARAARSHTFTVLSADPESASLPSGDMEVLSTQDECPTREATAPDPGLPDGDTRTSCNIRRLSSEPDSNSCESADHAKERTVTACEVYVAVNALDVRSKI